MTIAEVLRAAAHTLAEVSDTPRLDAELLMADVLGISRSALLLGRMQDDAPEAFAARIARRLAHEPVAYITGQQEFWSLTLNVSPAVLIPRADSETLIEAAIEALADRSPERILDLGTGSGALLLAALAQWPGAHGTGIDASEAALAIARENAAITGMGQRAQILHGDWRQAGWQDALARPFDLILANPPYVETSAVLAPQVMAHEPHSALFAGEDGLDDYRIVIPALPGLLAPDGIAILEIGATQCAAVAALAGASGFEVRCRPDLAGHDRAMILQGRSDA
jgi:release factor glutamine methyltransferase